MRHASLAFALAAALAACSVKDPLYCDGTTPCADPARPFCDLDGTYPASDGIKRTCIAYPWDASPDPDAGPACTPGEWTLDTIDNGTVGGWPALAVDRNGTVHVVYTAEEPSVLYYAHGRPSSWTVSETPESGGFYPQVAIDAADVIHIVHGAYPAGLRYLRKAISDEGFEYELVANPLAFDIGFDLGASDMPVACFLDADAGGPPSCHERTGEGWEPIEAPATGMKTGIAIAIDSSGTLHLTADGLVYFARSDDSWSSEETVSNQAASYTPVAVDSVGVPHVAYSVGIGGDIVHADRQGPDDWSRDVIESVVSARDPTLFVDANDGLHVAYVDVTNSNLKYARRDGGNWETQTVDSSATIPSTPRLFIDSKGSPHIVYTDQNDADLRYAYLCP